MTDGILTSQLALHPFLDGMAPSLVQVLAECSSTVMFQERSYLMRYQQPAKDFYLLSSGQVKLLNHVPGGRVTALETITAPGVVGWSWLVPPYRWHFDVQAVTAVQAIKIESDSLDQRMKIDTSLTVDLYRRFMQLLVERLQAARMQSMDIYANPALDADL